MDREETAEFDEDPQAAEVAPESAAVAPESQSVKIVPLSELEPSDAPLEPEVGSEPARQPVEVILEDPELGGVASEHDRRSVPRSPRRRHHDGRRSEFDCP